MKAWELRELLAGADPDALLIDSSGAEVGSVKVQMFAGSAAEAAFPAVVFDKVASAEVAGWLKAIASRLDDLAVDVDLVKEEIADALERA